MLVNSAQFWRTVGLFNNQKFLKCDMNQPFFSNVTVHQCHIMTFCTCSPSVLLPLILFLRSPPKQIKIQILNLAFAIRFSFICIFYSSIHIWLYTCTIALSGDVEKNLGPRLCSSQSFLICHWNLNSVTAHSYVKVSFLKAYLSFNRFDIVCLSETRFDPSVPLHEVNLEI